MSQLSRSRIAWEVLRSEGGPALCDRVRDRLAGWRRRRRFRLIAEVRPLAAPVLNLLPTPPRPELGGVQLQLRRRLAAEGDERPWALLYPEPAGFRLEVRSPGRREAMVVPAPARPADLGQRDEALERTIRDAASWAGAGAVHCEQAAGLPLESLLRVRDAGLGLVLSVHDFTLFCPRPHLLERPAMRFCHYCRDAERCRRCLGHDWAVDDGFPASWRQQANELLDAADAVIYPSEFLRRTYGELFPGLDAERQWVVEPPSVIPPTATAELTPGSRIGRVAYVGAVKAHKGAAVFSELLGSFPAERWPQLRWSVFGGGDRETLRRWRRRPGVRVRGYYRAAALPGLLRRGRVDLALLLSIWPESYALTADECLRAGVPVIAFDHGAIADRVRRRGGGVLVPPEAGAAGVAECLEEILAGGHRSELAAAAANLPDAAGAARAVAVIYRRLGLV